MEPGLILVAPTALTIALAMAAPFVQEDAAVIGAAAAAAADPGRAWIWLCACAVGLIASDLWKYWLGVLAHRSPRLARLAAKPQVAAARTTVVRRLGVALLIARFVPGTRIPLYIAAGYARAPFAKFAAFVAASALIYILLAYAIARALGAAMIAQAHGQAVGILLAVAAAAGIFVFLARRRAPA